MSDETKPKSSDNRLDLLEYRFNELRKSFDRKEEKDDKNFTLIKDAISSFSFVTEIEHQAAIARLELLISKQKEENEKLYQTKSDQAPFNKTLLFIATGIGGVIITIVVTRIVQSI